MLLGVFIVLILGLAFLFPRLPLPSRASPACTPFSEMVCPAIASQIERTSAAEIIFSGARCLSVALGYVGKNVFPSIWGVVREKFGSLSLVLSGSVGIGTTGPSKLLEVNGIAKIDTALIVPDIYPAADSTAAVQILKADGATAVLTADTTNSRIGIVTAAPGALLDIGSAGATLGTVRLEGNTGGYVQIQPSASTTSYTITLPAAAPTSSGYVLSSTTGGVTSWVAQSGGGGAISGLTAAAATNTIDNATYAQTWTWNTLAGANALSLTSSSTAAASNAQKMLNIALSGTNATALQTTYDAYLSNTHAGTTSTNVALYASASGGTTANYAGIFDAGNVGIGTTFPDSAKPAASIPTATKATRQASGRRSKRNQNPAPDNGTSAAASVFGYLFGTSLPKQGRLPPPFEGLLRLVVTKTLPSSERNRNQWIRQN
jgi:hypothetical protein